METFLNKIKLLAYDKSLRNRIIFTFGMLALFRFLATIPIPGIDALQLREFFARYEFFGLINVFSGGALDNLSIVMLGVGPYITASIIMQLMTIMSPKLKQIYQEEGEVGRKKFSQYSRILTVPLALLQAFGFLTLLSRQGAIADLSIFDMAVNTMIVAAGSVLLMWMGEIITEVGIGNGVSMIIFAGIVARLPAVGAQVIFNYDPAQIPLYIGFAVVSLIVVAGVVAVTEAERPVPVTYAKRVRGNRVFGGMSTYLPLRLNQAGVIPIIFALSILLFPQMIANFLAEADNEIVSSLARGLADLIANTFIYAASYFLLVFLFTYFYTAITFDPHAISENLQKNGAFVPGVRPGRSTAAYLGSIVTRITLVGALFLSIVAVLPSASQALTGLNILTIGGTALLIAVSVVLDLVRKIDAQIAMREY